MARPKKDGVDGSGFDGFIAKGEKLRSAAELGVSGAKWPTAKEMADGINKTASTPDVVRTPGQFLDPAYFDPLLFYIQHRDRRELNFRLRHAYEYDPVVGNLIDLHRTMPLSNYKLSCVDKSIEAQFNDFADNIELLNLSSYILGDYFLLGEATIWKVWDDYNKIFKEITLLPPEKIEVRKTYISKNPILLLHVDQELKRLVISADPVDQAIVKMMDPELREKIQTQDRIVLPQHQAFLFANKTSASDLRGTSPLKRALYALLLKYKIRILHNTFVDRACYPLKIFKLGSESANWVPSRSHFEALRNLLAQAETDPSFSLLFHFGLQVEYIGAKDKWENLLPHYEWCDKEIMYALFANEAVMTNKGTTFNNASTAIRALMCRYQMIRSQLELVWKNQIFRPMAEARGYWVPDSKMANQTGKPMKNRNGKFYYLDVPDFKWSKLNLLDDTAQKQFLMRLRERMEVPHKTIAEIFDLDAHELTQQLKAEEGTEVDPVWIETRKKAAGLDSVMGQVLQGRKGKELVLPKVDPLEEAKKTKKKKDIGSDKDDIPETPAPKPTGMGAPAPAPRPAPAPMPEPTTAPPPEAPGQGNTPGVTKPPI